MLCFCTLLPFSWDYYVYISETKQACFELAAAPQIERVEWVFSQLLRAGLKHVRRTDMELPVFGSLRSYRK
jgi:hypothetical protein